MYDELRVDVSRETVRAGVSRETFDRLESFVGLVQAWGTRINLIGPATIADIWSRHIADSLRLVDLIPPNTLTAVDLGSGAGFPGLVVAIVTNVHVDLIESDRRKAAFLAEAVRLTDATSTVHSGRIENCSCSPASLVMSRALAPLPRLLELASPFVASGGVCLFHKGRNVETEITAARKDWAMVAEQFHSVSDPSSVILRLRQVSRV